MTPFDDAFEKVAELVRLFEEHSAQYLSPKYQESEVRTDFIDKFFIALGWDVRHTTQTNPREQEVKVEKNPDSNSSGRRADYAFHLKPNYRDTVFFVEAKKPSVSVGNPDSYFQIVRYGRSARTPIGVLTDFQEFHIVDCRYEPNINKSFPSAQIRTFNYKDYLDKEKFGYLYWLFSREAIEAGKLKEFAKELPKQRGKGTAKLTQEEARPTDDKFLDTLETYRLQLAKAFKKADESLDAEALTEATQKVIDRLVFIRFLEDRNIEADYIVDQIAAKKGGAWKSFLAWSKELDVKYNGVVFKPHEIDKPSFRPPDEKVFESICSEISHRNSKYLFSYIPVELLGSIYERFLGKVVTATAKRADIEYKPEVRKAGGVYYTPKYIVDYIVANTVGRILNGDRGPGTGDRGERGIKKGQTNDTKLPGFTSVANGDGFDRRGIRSSDITSTERTVRTQKPNESGSDFSTEQYRGGMGSQPHEGIHPSPFDSLRLPDGNRDSNVNRDSTRVPDPGTDSEVLGVQLSNGPDAQSPNAVSRRAGTGVRGPGSEVASRSPSPRIPEPGPRSPLTPKEVSKLRFADIACGSGSFLIAVYDAVLHHVESYYNTHPDEAKKAGCIAIDKGVYALSLKQKQQILLDNIYGVDIDPQAVEVAQLSLFLKFLESESGAGASQLSFERTKILPDLSKNIVCGNSLVEYDIADLFPLTDAEEKRIKPFSFNSAFREVMQRGGFDAIVGNPPYGASFEPNVQKYLRKKYETASSTTDSYVLFIENASKQLCRNGMVGMIVQSGWVSAPSGRALRSYFAKALSPTDFVTLPYDVFGAYIDTIIFTAKKKEIAEEWPNSVRLVRFPVKHKIVNLTDFSAFTKIANPRTWLSSTNQEYLIGLSNAEQSIIQKVSENSKRLNTIADIQRGVTPFQLTPVKPKLNPYRAFNGTVRRYTITEDAPMFIRYDESLAEYKPARYFVGPRLLIREMISRQFRIQACFVEESFITNKSMQSVLLVDKNYDIHFVLGVLNSALISWYFLSVNSVGMRDDFPKIVLKQTRELPLPIIDPNDRKMMSQQNKVAGLASQMLSTKKQLAATSRDSDRERLRSKCDYLDVEIDKLVYQLYGLTAEEIRIIEAPAKGE